MNPGILFITLFTLSLSSSTPNHIHISLGDSLDEIRFTWSTSSETPTTYVRILQNNKWTHHQGTSVKFVGNSESWVIHTASVSLMPNAEYKYQVGCRKKGFSKPYTLLTPPDRSAARFLLFGDLSAKNFGPASWSTIESSFESLEIDTIIMLGNLADDFNSGSGPVAEEFMKMIQPVATQVPIMVCAGNHEKLDNYNSYSSRFHMPNTKFYYTYTVGFVRFVAIHTEAFVEEFDKIETMMEYLRKVLNRSREDRIAYPWLIVYGHRPLYCISKTQFEACEDEASVIRKHIEDEIFKNEVDIYVNSHVHSYQRTHPVFKKVVTSYFDDENNMYLNPLSTIYVTTGAIGQGDQDEMEELGLEWMGKKKEELSFSVMTVFNDTHLFWEQISADGKRLIDSFWVVKYIHFY